MGLRSLMYTHMDKINDYLHSESAKKGDRDELSDKIKELSKGTLSIDDLAYMVHRMDHVSMMIRQGYVSPKVEPTFYYGLLKNWRYLKHYVQFERDWRKNEGGNWWCRNYVHMVDKMLSDEYKLKLKKDGLEPLRDDYVN